jgi:quercetin dioxygenase-like cupin family protein
MDEDRHVARTQAALVPKALRRGEGQAIQVLGDPIVFKVLASQTRNACTIFEIETAPGHEIPAHRHVAEDEYFYVIDGEFEFTVGEDRFRAGPGAFVFVPRGVTHAVRNPGVGPARHLTIVTPGDQHEQALLAIGRPVSESMEPVDRSAAITIARQHGWEFPEPPGQAAPRAAPGKRGDR